MGAPTDDSISKNDEFYRKYVKYLHGQWPSTELASTYMDTSETVAQAVKTLQQRSAEMLLVEPVLLLAWILRNTNKQEYVTFNSMLQSIESQYVIYRRKMGGIGFIQT